MSYRKNLRGSSQTFMTKLAYAITLVCALVCVLSLLHLTSLISIVIAITVTFFVHLVIFQAFIIGQDRSGDLPFKAEYEPLEKKYKKSGDAAAYRDGLLNMENRPKTTEALNTYHMSLCEAYEKLGEYQLAVDELNAVETEDKEMRREIRNLRRTLKSEAEAAGVALVDKRFEEDEASEEE